MRLQTRAFLLAACGLLSHAACAAAAEPPVVEAVLKCQFSVPNARQGVAVDEAYFYVVDKTVITKHDKRSGAKVGEWRAMPDGTNVLIHMDGLVAVEGRLFAAHSNYRQFPMTSSVEIWDADSLTHVDNVSFGIQSGSLTWLDRYDGFWWGSFGNYDKVQAGQSEPYGLTDNTRIVKFDEHFRVLESWVLPQPVLDRMRPMSNSGGSWGPDGNLYLTGHDHGEVYVMQLPASGSVLRWIATVRVPVLEGQGIAWDRSISGRRLWGIRKADGTVVCADVPRIP